VNVPSRPCVLSRLCMSVLLFVRQSRIDWSLATIDGRRHSSISSRFHRNRRQPESTSRDRRVLTELDERSRTESRLRATRPGTRGGHSKSATRNHGPGRTPHCIMLMLQCTGIAKPKRPAGPPIAGN
jgi:hypothetical protein